LLKSKLENKDIYNSTNSDNIINLNNEEEFLNLKKDRSTITLQTNTNFNNRNSLAGNHIANNSSTRKSFGNFITEPNDTTMNSNSNFKDLNNNLAFKSKQTSIDYDNLRYYTQTESNFNKIQNKFVISEKQHLNPLIKNSKIKKASITEYANNINTNFNSTGNQKAITFVSPTCKNLDKDNFRSFKNNKFDKSQSKTKKDSNKLMPQIKGNLVRNKSSFVLVEKEEKNFNNPKNNQEKINLQDNIQKTICEGLIINRENEAENDINNNEYFNHQNQINLDFYKKSIEEHRKIMNSEHEIIADSLYDLAVHFLTFKNELLNSIKPTIINNQIHMNVNNFNQENTNNMNPINNINENLILNNDTKANLIKNNDGNDNCRIDKSIFGEFTDKK